MKNSILKVLKERLFNSSIYRGFKELLIYSTIKKSILYLAKFFGLFFISKRITQKGLKILAYHNFSDSELAKWKSQLFITSATFEKRMAYLKDAGFKVVNLDEAYTSPSRKKHHQTNVVITIDDGWYGVYKYAHKTLKKYDFPYTIYVTTYYCVNQMPVTNLMLEYLLYKTNKQKLILNDTFSGNKSDMKFEIISENQKQKCCKMLEEYIQNIEVSKRENYLKYLSGELAVDSSDMISNKILNIMTIDLLRQLNKEGADIQLHTHRHNWPLDRMKAMEEIKLNRDVLQETTNKSLEHLCYPSGYYSKKQFSFLRESKIKSATTCEPGFNYPSTHRYALNRFLDGENISFIEFQAEMSGFLEICRKIRSYIRRLNEHY